jgi:hypothetical protein
MRNNRIHGCIRWALAAVCLGALTSTATAGAFTRGCAARDMQVLMLIEERETAADISSEKLSDAFNTMMHARIVCYQGHVPEALAIYDSISQSITSNPILSGRDEMRGIR